MKFVAFFAVVAAAMNIVELAAMLWHFLQAARDAEAQRRELRRARSLKLVVFVLCVY